jgi:hypothetical protein
VEPHIYGHVAVNKENRFQMCLEPPGMFTRQKTHMPYLIIYGVLKTVIYGNIFGLFSDDYVMGTCEICN